MFEEEKGGQCNLKQQRVCGHLMGRVGSESQQANTQWSLSRGTAGC